MGYKVTAALVIAANQNGDRVYTYKDGVIPWLSDEDAERFVDEGLVEEVDDDEVAAADPTPGEPDGGPERPHQIAPKDAWVEYARSKGWSKDDAEAATKADLIAALP